MGALDDCEPCAGCGTSSPVLAVIWCQAWDQYLCGGCRRSRTDAELKATELANMELRLYGGGSAP